MRGSEHLSAEALEAFGVITEYMISHSPSECSDGLAAFLRTELETTPPGAKTEIFRVVLAQLDAR